MLCMRRDATAAVGEGFCEDEGGMELGSFFFSFGTVKREKRKAMEKISWV